MSVDFYHFILAIATTGCALLDDNKLSKALFSVSTTCWWLLFICDVIANIINT